MNSNRLFAAAVLVAAISFAMPLSGQAENTSVKGGAEEISEGAKADVKDSVITSKIKTALAVNPVTQSATINVETDHGIVNLTGNVPNVWVWEKAQDIVQNTQHVMGVRNNLRVENPSNASQEM